MSKLHKINRFDSFIIIHNENAQKDQRSILIDNGLKIFIHRPERLTMVLKKVNLKSVTNYNQLIQINAREIRDAKIWAFTKQTLFLNSRPLIRDAYNRLMEI